MVRLSLRLRQSGVITPSKADPYAKYSIILVDYAEDKLHKINVL